MTVPHERTAEKLFLAVEFNQIRKYISNLRFEFNLFYGSISPLDRIQFPPGLCCSKLQLVVWFVNWCDVGRSQLLISTLGQFIRWPRRRRRLGIMYSNWIATVISDCPFYHQQQQHKHQLTIHPAQEGDLHRRRLFVSSSSCLVIKSHHRHSTAAATGQTNRVVIIE